jgi:hypothetical protein
LGARLQDENQKKDMSIVFHHIRGFNNMDYIACWFYKAKQYIEGFNAECAFVSTNSICQGEQVALIWPNLISDKIEIDFAYQSFKWSNNAKGNAGVTVIIIGLRNISNSLKYIYINGLKKQVSNINAYLVDAKDAIVVKRTKPISKLPEINFGSMANDGGSLFLNSEEYLSLLNQNTEIQRYLKRVLGSREFINDIERWCIWIEDNEIEKAITYLQLKSRIKAVENHRLNSTRQSTVELADFSHRFAEIRHQRGHSIIIPRVSSERREYIPTGFLDDNYIISDSALAIYNAQPWIFGVISSQIHMVWVRNIGGQLETRIRYSASLCYNTFPFPDISEKQKEQINLHVFEVLEEREKHSGKTLAQLYDPDKMPKGLKEAHHQLDLAIERCYRLKPFESDTERLEYLFKEYEKMTSKNTLLDKAKRTHKANKV